MDLLLKWGADEAAVSCHGESPWDLITDAPDDHYDDDSDYDEDIHCSQDEIERARLLLARAPADRAWRRRGWVAMLRARGSMARRVPYDSTRGKEGECRKVARAGDTAGGIAHGHGGEGLGTVMAVLVDQAPEGVFRTVVGFL